ncbi:hypothetical protein [Pseudonocardia sp. GCM10023141]
MARLIPTSPAAPVPLQTPGMAGMGDAVATALAAETVAPGA